MKRKLVLKPAVPKGYTGNDFNKWIDYIKKQVLKIEYKNLKLD